MESNKWNMIWLAPWILLSTLVVEFCIFLPLFVVGIFASMLAFWKAPTVEGPSMIYPKTTITKFKWHWLDAWLGNYEDGLNPTWWVKANPTYSTWKTRFTWFLRNPVTNLRFWPVISTKPEPEKVKYIGSDTSKPDGIPCWFLAWQGPYGGFRYQTTTRNFWFGWKIKPEDRNGVPSSSYRYWGIGIAIQFNKADV